MISGAGHLPKNGNPALKMSKSRWISGRALDPRVMAYNPAL